MGRTTHTGISRRIEKGENMKATGIICRIATKDIKNIDKKLKMVEKWRKDNE